MITVKIYRGIDDEEVGTITSDGDKLIIDPKDDVSLKRIISKPVKGRTKDGMLDPHKDPDKFVRLLHYAYHGSAVRASAPEEGNGKQTANSSESDPEMEMVEKVQQAGEKLKGLGIAMPGYGQIFRNSDNDLWYVGGDGDEDDMEEWVKDTLQPLTSGKVIYEAEAFPPRNGSWFKVYPKHERYGDNTANQSNIIAAGLAVVAKDSGRTLMLQRALDDDNNGGHWEFPSGHREESTDA